MNRTAPSRRTVSDRTQDYFIIVIAERFRHVEVLFQPGFIDGERDHHGSVCSTSAGRPRQSDGLNPSVAHDELNLLIPYVNILVGEAMDFVEDIPPSSRRTKRS